MNEDRAPSAEISAEAKTGSPAAGEAGLAPEAPLPGGLGPAWLAPDAEMVFGFVCQPGEPLDPSWGGPPWALAAASIAMLIVCGSLALVLCGTYSGYAELRWLDADERSVVLARETVLVYSELAAAIVAVATFSLWYRALTDRARAVAILRPLYSARYALAMLLIPVANLLGPIQTFSLLWDALSPRKERYRDLRAGFVMAGWWCLVLGAFVLGRLVAVHRPIVYDANDFSVYYDYYDYSLVEALAWIQRAQRAYAVACAATVLLIVRFTRRLGQAHEHALEDPERRQMWPVDRRPNLPLLIGLILGYGIVALLCVASFVRAGHPASASFTLPFVRPVRRLVRGAIASPASKRMYLDQRRPILILRAFKNDGRLEVGGVLRVPLEDMIEKVVRKYGPLVALGRPGESVPLAGASRLYVPQFNWQSAARALIDSAQFVIIPCLASSGLRWELGQLCASGQLGKIVLVPPIVGSRRRCWDDWKKFLSICPETLATALSAVPSLDRVLYIVIDRAGSASVFEGAPTAKSYATQLQAVLAQLGAQGGRSDQTA